MASKRGAAMVPDRNQLNKLKRTAREQKYGERDLCLVNFSYILGMRCAEIALFNYDDLIDNDGNIRDMINLRPETTKGKKSRELSTDNKELRESIEEYLSVRGEGGTRFFKTQREGQFSPDSLQAHFRRMYQATGFPKGYSSHSGRRWFATKMFELGIDPLTIQEMMGHASITQTAKYAVSSPKRKANAIKQL